MQSPCCLVAQTLASLLPQWSFHILILSIHLPPETCKATSWVRLERFNACESFPRQHGTCRQWQSCSKLGIEDLLFRAYFLSCHAFLGSGQFCQRRTARSKLGGSYSNVWVLWNGKERLGQMKDFEYLKDFLPPKLQDFQPWFSAHSREFELWFTYR